ncbi:MAG: DUF507 family protein [bacterium]|nr:DUF507 family protein [bacterium]
MRLSKNKIEHLSDKIMKMIVDNPNIHVTSSNDLVIRAVDDAIFENMRDEDEIDQKVDAIMQQNIHEIKAEEMDVGSLRNQIKRQMCRKAGFVL